LVEDIPNLTHAIISDIKNYAQFVEQTLNTAQTVENQVTQIERFGDPSYYVNILQLNPILGTITQLKNGIGETIADVRQAANGADAIAYTADGIYQDLTGRVDRFGNPIQWNTDAFRKFQTVNNMVESYNTQQGTFNEQMAVLQQELATALQNLNADKTQMGSMKFEAQIHAITGQMNALSQTTNLGGQRMQIQQYSNQNDAGRTAEADRQQEIQERIESLQAETATFKGLIGGQ